MSTPISQLNIFDFDQTISKQHTFGESRVKAKQDLNVSLERCQARIKLGADRAGPNLKKDLPRELFSLEGGNLFAIATYHNNPDHIAGYLQQLLAEKITPTDEIHYSEDPVVAVRVYKIEGSDKPLLISYLPATGDDFQALIKKLDGKNNQINLLKKVALDKELVNGSTHYDFFDDSEANIKQARKGFDESNLTAHHIDKNNYSFSLVDNSTDITHAIERSKASAKPINHTPIPTAEHDELYDFDDADETSSQSAPKVPASTSLMTFALQHPKLLSAGVGLLAALAVVAACVATGGIATPVIAGIAAGAGLLSSSATFFAASRSNTGRDSVSPVKDKKTVCFADKLCSYH